MSTRQTPTPRTTSSRHLAMLLLATLALVWGHCVDTGQLPEDYIPPDAPAPVTDVTTATDGTVVPVESLGLDCAFIHQQLPDLSSGYYLIDPDGDGPDAPFEAYCDMTTQGGGWTVVFDPTTPNYNMGQVDYTVSSDALLGGAEEALVAHRDASLEVLDTHAVLAFPPEWATTSPFMFAGESQLLTVVYNEGLTLAPGGESTVGIPTGEHLVFYGYEDFDAVCGHGPQGFTEGAMRGQFCIEGVYDAPAYVSFADAETDLCTRYIGTAAETLAGPQCSADRRFTLAVRRAVCSLDDDCPGQGLCDPTIAGCTCAPGYTGSQCDQCSGMAVTVFVDDVEVGSAGLNAGPLPALLAPKVSVANQALLPTHAKIGHLRIRTGAEGALVLDDGFDTPANWTVLAGLMGCDNTLVADGVGQCGSDKNHFHWAGSPVALESGVTTVEFELEVETDVQTHDISLSAMDQSATAQCSGCGSTTGCPEVWFTASFINEGENSGPSSLTLMTSGLEQDEIATLDFAPLTPGAHTLGVRVEAYPECVCTPSCAADNACGDDGCGGSCGTCALGLPCTDGACEQEKEGAPFPEHTSGGTPDLSWCTSSLQCQKTSYCVDNSGDQAFFCKQTCQSETDCAAVRALFPGTSCNKAYFNDGVLSSTKICNEGHVNVVDYASSDGGG